MAEIRIVIADDHPGMREGIRILLSQIGEAVVVAEAADGIEALAAVERWQPDVLLLDVEMPQMTGLEVAAALSQLPAAPRILALSAHSDREYIVEMLRLGAAGYLVKDEAAGLLAEAVRGLMRGETGWFSPLAAQKLKE